MATPFPSEKILESNLKYFEIHAAQRLTVFNFYVALSGTILAGIAAISQGSARFALAGAVLGLLLAAISFVFLKLDERTSFLVKHAEGIIKKIESEYLPQDLGVFGLEESSTFNAQRSKRFPCKMYTYGQLFSTIFWIFGLIGLIGFIVMGLRAVGVIDWAEPQEKAAEISVVVKLPTANMEKLGERTNSTLNPRGAPSPSNDVSNVASKTNLLSKHKPAVVR